MSLHRRLTAVLAALGLVALGAATAAAAPPPPERTRHTYRGEAGVRDYLLTVPRVRDARRARPLVVFLHGCTQTADDGAVASRFDDAARARGFLVAYPEQDPVANGSRCWNWFLPEHQHREAGEPALIAGITREVMRTQRVDPRRVYVLGISAGGDMTAIMGATYPDLYAGISVIAGCAYLSCADADGRMAYAEMGPRARLMPTMVVQGSIDMENNAAMGEGALKQWLGTNDLADNGDADGSVDQEPRYQLFYGPTTPSPPGDYCVAPDRTGFPCLGGLVGWQDRYPYTERQYADSTGRVLVVSWLIHGLDHAYGGGDTSAAWTDPLGPDVTKGVTDFLLAQRR